MSEVKTMLALYVPAGYSNAWICEQLEIGGFDCAREYLQIGHSDDDGEQVGTWLMQEVISKIH